MNIEDGEQKHPHSSRTAKQSYECKKTEWNSSSVVIQSLMPNYQNKQTDEDELIL